MRPRRDVIRFAELSGQEFLGRGVAASGVAVRPAAGKVTNFIAHAVIAASRKRTGTTQEQHWLHERSDRAHAHQPAPDRCLRAWLCGYPVSTLSSRRALWICAVAMPIPTASFSRWKAISMAAASQFDDAAPVSASRKKADCTRGNRSGTLSHPCGSLFDYAVALAGRLPLRHLFIGKSSECATVSPVVRWLADCALAFDADANGSIGCNRCRGVSGLKVYPRDASHLRTDRTRKQFLCRERQCATVSAFAGAALP